jgi:hypothetical protein
VISPAVPTSFFRKANSPVMAVVATPPLAPMSQMPMRERAMQVC